VVQGWVYQVNRLSVRQNLDQYVQQICHTHKKGKRSAIDKKHVCKPHAFAHQAQSSTPSDHMADAHQIVPAVSRASSCVAAHAALSLDAVSGVPHRSTASLSTRSQHLAMSFASSYCVKRMSLTQSGQKHSSCSKFRAKGEHFKLPAMQMSFDKGWQHVCAGSLWAQLCCTTSPCPGQSPLIATSNDCGQ
jgi:hypothetical protein